jgi:hypothetical protein
LKDDFGAGPSVCVRNPKPDFEKSVVVARAAGKVYWLMQGKEGTENSND